MNKSFTVYSSEFAEGYYSVGLARSFPSARIYSFDVDPWARAQQRRLGQINSVNNLTVGGLCRASDLARLVSRHTLIICDIEGHEYNLIDPEKSPSLERCDILIEIHPNEQRNLSMAEVSEHLSARFFRSHKITTIQYTGRHAAFASAFDHLTDRMTMVDVVQSVDEHRYPNQLWLWLETRTHMREIYHEDTRSGANF
jgi:hypothetical protein